MIRYSWAAMHPDKQFLQTIQILGVKGNLEGFSRRFSGPRCSIPDEEPVALDGGVEEGHFWEMGDMHIPQS